VNRDIRLRQIRKFLRRKRTSDVDTFGIYQWIDRCYYEGWWSMAVALGQHIPPNTLNESYRKRLEFLLGECRRRRDCTDNEQSSVKTNVARHKSQAGEIGSSYKKMSDRQRARNSLLENIKTYIEQKLNLGVRINLHPSGVLRVSARKAGLVIELWIDKHDRLFLGVVFPNIKARKVLFELLEPIKEYLPKITEHTFQIHEGKGASGRGWIFSEIVYDRHKPLQDHLEFFALKYVLFIIAIKNADVFISVIDRSLKNEQRKTEATNSEIS